MDDFYKTQLFDIIKSIEESIKKLDKAYLELDAIAYDLKELKELIEDKLND